MSATETKPTVHEAWAQVMADVKAVAKTGHNKQQDYNFRGIDGVLNAAGPAMREHGVVVIPSLLDASYRDVEVGAKRTLMREATVKVRYTIIGPAGDTIDYGEVPGESLDSGDKGTAKAMSVAYRIFLLQALSIPTHEPDADESTYERSAAVADTGNPADLLAEGELLAADAKARLLTALEGDKAAATAAWHLAGLDGKWKVTAEHLAALITKATAATEETDPNLSGSASTTSVEGAPAAAASPAPSTDPEDKPGAATALRQQAEAMAEQAARTTKAKDTKADLLADEAHYQATDGES